MRLKSTAFAEGDLIPSQYTCDGNNISPPLNWDSAPADTQTFALICDDPDAPIGTWVHWVIFNIPAEIEELPEAIAPNAITTNGALHGTNDFRYLGYGGPCPPSGTHRYFFKLYALDAKLNLSPGIRKEELIDAMKGHILAEAQLIGKYQRK